MDYADLRIDYRSHTDVQRLLDCLVYSLEGVSLAFDRWTDEYVRGPASTSPS